MALSEAHELVGGFAELIFGERDPSVIWPAMLRRLEQAVGFDAGYIAASFGASTEGRGAVLEHDAVFLKRNLGRFLAEISAEEVTTYTDRARAHVDVWTSERQRELAVFQEVLNPTGMKHMAVRASVRAGNVAGFNLERRGYSSPFSEHQLALIDLVGPFLHVVELLTLDFQDAQSQVDFAEQHGLTPREAELVELVARGLQNAEIGLLLGVSTNTVRNTLVRVFEKAGVTTRSELTYHATRQAFDRPNRTDPLRPSRSDDGTAVFMRRVEEAAAGKAPAPESGKRVCSSSEIIYAPPLQRVPA